MPIDYSFYYRVNQDTRQASKQQRIEMIQKNSNALFEDGLVTGFDVKIGTFLKEKAFLNFEKEIDCLIEFERMKEKVYNSNSRGIKCYPNIIKTGDYVSHVPIYNQEANHRTYLVRSMVDNRRGYDHAFLTICQQKISFLDKGGDVVTYPINVNDNRSKMNESFEKSALVDDATTYECYVQDNEHTRQIVCSDEKTLGQVSRFIIKGRAYKVQGIDDMSMQGLITLKLKIDKVSPLDNLELCVADYYKHKDPEEDPAPDKEFVINGEREILLDDGDYTYEINADESNGEIVRWSINSIKGVRLLIDKNDSVRIRVDNNVALKGKIVELKATIYDIDYTKNIKIVNW